MVLDLNPLVVRLNDRLGLNVTLPEGAGTYVIADSDELAAAQTAVAVIDPLSILLIIAVLVLLAAAVYLAAGFRRETLRAIAFSLIVIGVLLLVVRRLVGTALVEALTDDTTRSTGWAVWVLGTNLLREVAVAILAYGIVLLLGVLLAGPTRWATWIRAKLAPVMRERPWIVYGSGRPDLPPGPALEPHRQRPRHLGHPRPRRPGGPRHLGPEAPDPEGVPARRVRLMRLRASRRRLTPFARISHPTAEQGTERSWVTSTQRRSDTLHRCLDCHGRLVRVSWALEVAGLMLVLRTRIV